MNKNKESIVQKEEKSGVNKYSIMFKSLFMALILSLILVVIYALALSFTAMSDTTMSIVTQTIIIISIAVSSIYCSKHIGNKGWLYGLILGLVFVLILIPINILFGHQVEFDKFFIVKTLMGSTVGLIGGVIGVNLS